MMLDLAITFVAERRERLVALCKGLVEAPSAQPQGDTTAPAGVLADFLRGEELSPTLLAAVTGKPNLVCAVEGAGPGRQLGLLGHLDTLPAGDTARWTVPPLQLTRRRGRLYGLGIGNMKAAVAGLALALVFLARHRERWRGRVVLSAVADEVLFGADGAAWLLEQRSDLLGDAVICGEGPGFMGLAAAEKGLLWAELSASGPPGQGMLAEVGSSPIARLAAALAELDGWNAIRTEPPGTLAGLSAGPGGHGLRLSANLGRVEGGTLVSQVATEVRAEVDFRIPPGLGLAQISARLDALAGKHGLSWRRIKGWEPNWTPPDSELTRRLSAAAEVVRGEAPLIVVRLPASDASRWRARGVPAICYGPQPTLVAGVDDFVHEQDVLDCAAVYMLAALDYLGGA